MLEPRDTFLWRFSQMLHGLNDDITRLPLPELWIELIQGVNDQDLMAPESSPRSDQGRNTGVFLIVDNDRTNSLKLKLSLQTDHLIPMPLKR